MIRGDQAMKKTHMSAKILLSVAILLFGASCAGGGEENKTSDTAVQDVPETSPPKSEAPAESTPVRELPFMSIEDRGTTRDCYDIEGDMAVVSQNCDALHHGQIISTGQLLLVDPAAVDQEVFYVAAVEVCANDFRRFTGDDPENADSRWILRALIEGEFSDGIYVSCTVEAANGDQWGGTAEEINGSYFGIEVGDCFNFPTTTSNALKIDCMDPHEGEMYIVDESVLDENASASYPTEEEWDAIATLICDGPFEEYTGYSASDESSALSYTFVFVLEEDWYNVENRLLSCAVVLYDGTLLEGSIRN